MTHIVYGVRLSCGASVPWRSIWQDASHYEFVFWWEHNHGRGSWSECPFDELIIPSYFEFKDTILHLGDLDQGYYEGAKPLDLKHPSREQLQLLLDFLNDYNIDLVPQHWIIN